VDLRSVAACAACCCSTSEDKCASNSLVLRISQGSELCILRDRRSPEVVRTLDDLGNNGRYLIIVSEREQVRPH
jgi:hypothetical protein